jgi:hypothetical protein
MDMFGEMVFKCVMLDTFFQEAGAEIRGMPHHADVKSFFLERGGPDFMSSRVQYPPNPPPLFLISVRLSSVLGLQSQFASTGIRPVQNGFWKTSSWPL